MGLVASLLVSSNNVLLVEGLRDEAGGPCPVGLRQPLTVEDPMSMGLESIPERGAGVLPGRLSQAVGARGGVPLAL